MRTDNSLGIILHLRRRNELLKARESARADYRKRDGDKPQPTLADEEVLELFSVAGSHFQGHYNRGLVYLERNELYSQTWLFCFSDWWLLQRESDVRV